MWSGLQLMLLVMGYSQVIGQGFEKIMRQSFIFLASQELAVWWTEKGSSQFAIALVMSSSAEEVPLAGLGLAFLVSHRSQLKPSINA